MNKKNRKNLKVGVKVYDFHWPFETGTVSEIVKEGVNVTWPANSGMKKRVEFWHPIYQPRLILEKA